MYKIRLHYNGLQKKKKQQQQQQQGNKIKLKKK